MSKSTATPGPTIHQRLGVGDIVSPKYAPALQGKVLEVDHRKDRVRFEVGGMVAEGSLDLVIAR